MKKKILLSIAVLLIGTTLMFAQGDIRHDNKDIRHDQRDINHDRFERNKYLAQGRYRAAAHEQRDINHDRRDLYHDRMDRNHDVRGFYRR